MPAVHTVGFNFILGSFNLYGFLHRKMMKGCGILKFTPYLLFIWCAFILVAGCTYDAHAFLYDQVIGFNFEVAPNFHDLLITNDIHLTKEFYVIQKMGHIFAFAVLYFLLLSWIKRNVTAFILCGMFALYTEILQLYFSRNGRIFDVGVDLLGILLSYLMCKIILLSSKGYKASGEICK
jgi:hypothetical protein